MYTMKARKSVITAVVFVAFMLILQGCGGGGGKTSSSSASSTPTVEKSTINGQVTIEGVADCSNVVVVAEKVAGGVTRTVAKMLESAAAGTRSSAKVSADTTGVYMASTDNKCSYSISVPADNYSVSAYKEDTVGAVPQRITARAASVVTVNFELVATGKVAGSIILGVPGNDIVFAYLDGTSFAAFADSSGNYVISNVPVGTYDLIFARAGKKYATNSGVVVAAGTTTNDALTSVDLLCVMDSDCDDASAYTGDTCDNPATLTAACSYVTFACIENADCDDANSNTSDSCIDPSTVDAFCQNSISVAGGSISVDTTWSISDSPVIIEGQISVDPGVTLTIDPGVVVKFAYPAVGPSIFGLPAGHDDLGGIDVQGTLNAVGTITEPTTFTLENPSSGAGRWGGIMIGSGASGNLQYVNMEYPSFGIQVSYATVANISNVNITYAGTPEGDASIYNSNPPYSYSNSYYVYAKSKTGWQQVGFRHYGLQYREQSVDLSGYLPDADGEYKVRIQQVGMNAAQVDSVALLMDGMKVSPVAAYDVATREDALYKMASTDNDVWDAHLKTFEVKFEGSHRVPSSITLALNAREEGSEVISAGMPFTFPRNMYSATAATARYYSYVMGSNAGSAVIDGELTSKDQLPAPAFAERVHPDSGHPAGVVYGYIKNDGTYLYGTLDFTTDNTMDDTADYATLHVLSNGVDKAFRVSIIENAYGKVGFTYTSAVNYQHKVYEFKVPLSEIGSPQKGQEVKYLVEAYGTSSIFNSAIYVTNVDNFSMSDVSISFDPSANGYTNGIKLEYLGTGPHSLSNISLVGVPNYGLYIYGVNNLTIAGLDIAYNKGNSGLYVDSSDGLICNNCDVSNTQNNDNVYLSYTTNFAFTDCVFNNAGSSNGVYIYYGTGTNSFTNCDISFNGYIGVYSNSSNIDIQNSRIQESCSYGIYGTGTGYGETLSVTNTNIIDNANYAINNGGGLILNLDGVFMSGNAGVGSGVVDDSGTLTTSQIWSATSILNPASTIVVGPPTTSGVMQQCGI